LFFCHRVVSFFPPDAGTIASFTFEAWLWRSARAVMSKSMIVPPPLFSRGVFPRVFSLRFRRCSFCTKHVISEAVKAIKKGFSRVESVSDYMKIAKQTVVTKLEEYSMLELEGEFLVFDLVAVRHQLLMNNKASKKKK
jgi:hypothetical protein